MLDREGVARVVGEAFTRFLADPPSDPQQYIVRSTSGTSGRDPMFAIIPHAGHLRSYAQWFAGAERILLCAGSVTLRSYYSVLTAQLNPACRVLTFDRSDMDESRAELIRDFAPDRIVGVPSVIARAIPLFDAETAAKVRSIKCCSELTSRQYIDLFATTFRNANVTSAFIITETGPLSEETCAYQPINFFHPIDGVRFEIELPDETGVGELLVSAKAYADLPIGRYRTGDMARGHAGLCACGAKETFEILGRRGYDYIKLAGALLVRDEFDRVAALFPEIHDYRVEASIASGERGIIGTVTVIAFAPTTPTPDRQREITEAFARAVFVTAEKTLADLSEKGLFVPLSITWTDVPFTEENKMLKMREV